MKPLHKMMIAAPIIYCLLLGTYGLVGILSKPSQEELDEDAEVRAYLVHTVGPEVSRVLVRKACGSVLFWEGEDDRLCAAEDLGTLVEVDFVRWRAWRNRAEE